MFTRKFFSVILCLSCYVFTSNVFAHLSSMNMMTTPQEDTEVVMSDCGMEMKVSSENTNTSDDCFERCFGPYDDLSNVAVSITSTSKYYTTTNDLLILSSNTFDGYENHPSHAPPDDRCITHGKKTPYFSHSDTTQIE